VTLTLDWDRARFHPIDSRMQRVEVPFPQELSENVRTSLASALVGLEVVGGPIEDAKLSRSHIRMEITRDADLGAIPENQRSQFILQERVRFEGVIQTPHGATQAEIRIMFLWMNEEPGPVMSLVRMGRGMMMGVDHNRNLEWVGASAALWT